VTITNGGGETLNVDVFTWPAADVDAYTCNVGFNGAAAQAGGSPVITSVMSVDQGARNNNREYQITVPDVTKNEILITVYDTSTPNDTLLSTTTYTVPVPRNDGMPADVTVGDLIFTFAAGTTLEDLDGITVNTAGGVDAAALGTASTAFSTQIDRIQVDENLYNITIDKNGNIVGIVKNDGVVRCPTTGDPIQVEAEQRVIIGRLALATFDNQQGLEKVGSNLYRVTANTGEAQYKEAGTDGAGQINPGALEMSNVDLAQEFTDMIITQRGFQANSRIITVSDTLLEELINLKR
jgi:flagellar hook protein FlgE